MPTAADLPGAGTAQSAVEAAQDVSKDPLAAAQEKAQAAAVSTVPGAAQAEAAKDAAEETKDQVADAAKDVGRAVKPKGGGGES